MKVRLCSAGLSFSFSFFPLTCFVFKVCDELDGKMPATAADLQKLLPGVGRYTSCKTVGI